MKRAILSYAILAAVVLIGTVSTAHATSITWTLNNVVFSDAGTASGTFSIDSVTGDLLTYDITTIQTTTGYTGYVYTPLTTSTPSFTSDSLSLFPTGSNAPEILAFIFQDSLSTPGLNLLLPSSYEEGSNCCGTFTRTVVGGYATAVPEPGTYTMMLAGLGLLGSSLRRKQLSA